MVPDSVLFVRSCLHEPTECRLWRLLESGIIFFGLVVGLPRGVHLIDQSRAAGFDKYPERRIWVPGNNSPSDYWGIHARLGV